MQRNSQSEARRLESLWSGEFGHSYTERNIDNSDFRAPFWSCFLARYHASRILEVGCNIGSNLRCVERLSSATLAAGVDVNEGALRRGLSVVQECALLNAAARDLPFKTGSFDLVFTSGVLIHQPEETLLRVMSEIVRCSNRYVLCMEYESDKTVEVPYRGQEGALFKRNYRDLYLEKFPNLQLIDQAFLPRSSGWDDLTVGLFERVSRKSV